MISAACPEPRRSLLRFVVRYTYDARRAYEIKKTASKYESHRSWARISATRFYLVCHIIYRVSDATLHKLVKHIQPNSMTLY